jgi:hypothetical protein
MQQYSEKQVTLREGHTQETGRVKEVKKVNMIVVLSIHE